ncbi:C3HC zinc finger domain-containing protein [Plectosphaerella plurivora]|uniref:C3HC zinc finger domain-containing protein n=1 Tax=Plectosphaerella plurivora TaxID=936078 RepID=A0A9P8VAL9_9PEZI|nr:C3HC zinc finger domain-containing protein [Plectosphaerella plurivora]
MNATKRKFNALIQGMGSRSQDPNRYDNPSVSVATPSPTSTALTAEPSPKATTISADDVLAKRQRLQALKDKHAAATQTIKSAGSTTRISNVVLKKWTTSSEPPVQVATKYCPTDRSELLRRLATFQEITDWTPKPDKVSEYEWAKRGWVCQGKERVRCSLCNKELLVKLNKREVDGKEVPVVVASGVEEALVDKYAELIVTAHQEDCLWMRRGCEDTLLRLSLTNARASYEAIRERYDELCERKSFLPYNFNLRLPDGLDVDSIISQLPTDFFTNPPPKTDMQHPNKVALALALTGWQGLSNTRIGAVPNSASCHTCLRRLGLWMFKSKEVGPGDEVLVPAPMDHLDPAREHRFFCPWKNADTQRLSTAKPGSGSDAPAWTLLVQVIKNDAYLRGALDERPQTRGRGGKENKLLATPTRPTTPGARGHGSLDVASPGVRADAVEDDETARDAKDKERWARLRRVKSLFETKGSRKRRGTTASRPDTANSTASVVSAASKPPDTTSATAVE